MTETVPVPTTPRQAEEALAYVCPLCKGELTASAEAYACPACQRRYPIVWGIPDFRIFPDPYIGIDDDHRKGLRLAERYDTADARALMEFYWSITLDTPAELAQRYMRHDLAGEARGRAMLAGLEGELGREFGARETILELGCRTGGLLAAAAERGGKVVGIDIAFRWLVVAKKRLQQQGLHGQLACCCAQYLPFKPRQFDLVIGGNILEHSREQGRIFTEARRVLRPRGMFHIVTVNRYSLAGEPHVGLWGVGFLPRRWMNPYVRWRKAVAYEHVRLLSVLELRRMIRRAGFAMYRMDPPAIGQGELEGLPRHVRWGVGVYNHLRRWPLVRQALLACGPLLQGTCVGESS
jgi:SAM-dependent methyltransferase